MYLIRIFSRNNTVFSHTFNILHRLLSLVSVHFLLFSSLHFKYKTLFTAVFFINFSLNIIHIVINNNIFSKRVSQCFLFVWNWSTWIASFFFLFANNVNFCSLLHVIITYYEHFIISMKLLFLNWRICARFQFVIFSILIFDLFHNFYRNISILKKENVIFKSVFL